MSGHGWVKPLPGGAKARCGGPGICDECSREANQHGLGTSRTMPRQRTVVLLDLLANVLGAAPERPIIGRVTGFEVLALVGQQFKECPYCHTAGWANLHCDACSTMDAVLNVQHLVENQPEAAKGAP